MGVLPEIRISDNCKNLQIEVLWIRVIIKVLHSERRINEIRNGIR